MDSAVIAAVSNLFFMALGQCLAYRLARTFDGTSIGGGPAFDHDLAQTVDYVCLGVVGCYLVVYCIGYKFLFVWWKMTRGKGRGGMRRWREGRDFRNKNVKPREGEKQCYRLWFTEDFLARGSFLGMGREVKAEDF